MAFVNISEWSPDQVASWLKGLNGKTAPYILLFQERQVKGQQLLTLRSDDLETLGVHVIGHQELLLEAIEHLRNFHYELHRENVQQLAMRLSCVATSLCAELRSQQDSGRVETQTLSDVAHVIAAVKPLVCWLDRSPFLEQPDFSERKSALLKRSLEAATCAQRDRFADRPTFDIDTSCKSIAALADYIIQDVSDPMILQTATLDTVILKKKDNQLGFDIVPSFSGHHQIANIKFGSPAHASGKIEEGDEIVQVNYQTVIGWCPEQVREACLNTSPLQNLVKEDLVLTLRRRPGARASVLATPQLRPFRPLKRPWPGVLHAGGQNRIRLWDNRDVLALRFRVPSAEPTPEVETNTSSDESEILSPPGSPTALEPHESQNRLYLPKPRTLVQRRNTISGSSPISKRPNVSIEQFWQELKNHKNLNHTGSAQMQSEDGDEISNNLYRRDKAISYSAGLELSNRPKTCLGVGFAHPAVAKLKAKKAIADHNDADSQKNRGKLDKSHSTPAYDFDNNTNDEHGSLVTQIIPESPTTPTDSPTIVIHSAEKADQILDFKKSSCQIGEAILQQKNKSKETSDIDANKNTVKFNFPDNSSEFSDVENNVEVNKDEELEKVLETINIAMMEHQNRGDKQTTHKYFKTQMTTYSENGEKSTKTFLVNEHVESIQNEIVQAINEQRITTTKTTVSKPSDVPPEPPPRPHYTQKTTYIIKEPVLPVKDSRIKDYPSLISVRNQDNLEKKEHIPLKPLKNINASQISAPFNFVTKHDLPLTPNLDMSAQRSPNRKEIHLPLNYEGKINMNLSQVDINKLTTSLDKKNYNIMSNPDLASSNLSPDMSGKSPNLIQSQSLQRLETEVKLSPKLNVQSSARIESPKVVSPSNSSWMFSSSKSKSLKKKNSILAKRRKVSVKDLGLADLQGILFQRCRTKSNSTVVWDEKWYVLQGNTLYGFKSKDATKADCLIFLNGFTVSEAQEVKSKPFAFKVYHTGTVFYFAAESTESMKQWYDFIIKATMLNYDSWERAHKKDKKVDESKHFSETDYSDGDFSSDKESNDKSKNEGKEKDKSKFGSLKKFANRIHKTESQENVSHSSTSLDRKYLRFFSPKYKNKEDKSKSKHVDVPVPTEQYRSYRKISSNQPPIQPSTSYTKIPQDLKENVAEIRKIEAIEKSPKLNKNTSHQKSQKKLPINYIHASNPNLIDFEKSDFKPLIPASKLKIERPENFSGFVTLHEFMMKKQEEERKQVYSNRVLMGIERDTRKEEQSSLNKKAAKELQKQLDKIVPDVIYGELPTYDDDNDENLPVTVVQLQNRSLPKTPDKTSDTFETEDKKHDEAGKPISVKGKDGYEKIVYTLDSKTEEIHKESIFEEPPKVLPRKPSLVRPEDLKSTSADILRKCSLTSAKDLGYEVIYGDENARTSECDNQSDTKSFKNLSASSSKDLGYETLFSNEPSESSATEEPKVLPRRMSDERPKPIPPPKIMPKSQQVLNRQNSLTSSNRNSGPDMNPVFKQGESPEKFWLNSLRRNDKIHQKPSEFTQQTDKFYTKVTEPAAFVKSSEATIVKSDKVKNLEHFSTKGGDSKMLKSATQYTPMSLPLSGNTALKTSPKFEINLDSKPETSSSGIFRLRQIFQPGGQNKSPSPTKEKTILGSPRLHRAIFRKQHSASQSEDLTQDFTYTKGPSSTNIQEPDQVIEVTLQSEVSDDHPSPLRNMSTPDYPHLEYPPTFEPESYSLADQNLLRRKGSEKK